MNIMKKHALKCWVWKGLWALSALSFILAWVSVLMQAPIGRFDPLFLLWNALVLAVLATPIKLDCHDCSTCNVAAPVGTGMDHSHHEQHEHHQG